MTLKLNGYSTAQFGKCHEVPVWQSSPMGPFDAWPSGGGGFETFYGFIGGENNQWDPALYDGTTPVEPPATPEEGYHLTEDLADRAVGWIRQQKALMPDRPFFVYFAPGATHAPHHVPKEWVDKYQGQFDDGWDALRERTFARQKELGVIPADAELTARHDEIPAWDDMPDELKPVLARADGGLRRRSSSTPTTTSGRLIDAIEDLGVLDNTIVYYIIGDNGASAEGTLNGAFNEMANFNGMAALETPEFLRAQDGRVRLAELLQPLRGRLGVGDEHAVPVDQAGRLALGRHPQRDDRALARGHRRAPAGCARSSPTSSTSPRRSSRPPGCPSRRWSTACSSRPWRARACSTRFDEPDAAERHDLQYFEMFGNRGIYHRGWSAVTKHRTPWVMVGGERAGLRRRRLGALRRQHRLQPGPRPVGRAARDARQAAAAVAHRGREVQRAAASTTAPPSASSPDMAGRPTLIHGTSQLFFPGHGPAVGEQRGQHQEQVVLASPREVDVPAGVPRA